MLAIQGGYKKGNQSLTAGKLCLSGEGVWEG